MKKVKMKMEIPKELGLRLINDIADLYIFLQKEVKKEAIREKKCDLLLEAIGKRTPSKNEQIEVGDVVHMTEKCLATYPKIKDYVYGVVEKVDDNFINVKRFKYDFGSFKDDYFEPEDHKLFIKYHEYRWWGKSFWEKE